MSKGEMTMYRMISSWKISVILFLFTFLVIGVLPAQAAIDPNKDTPGEVYVDPNDYDNTDTWEIDDSLVVGEGDGPGSLTIDDGSDVVVGADVLVGKTRRGISSDYSSWVTVNGVGSTLTIGDQLIIGAGMDPNVATGTTGLMYIWNGGVVDVTGDTFLGYGKNSWGYMDVDQASRLNYNGTLYIGYGGGGHLDIDYGWADSPVELDAILGYQDGSSGTLNIWNVNNQQLNLVNNDDNSFTLGHGDASYAYMSVENASVINVDGDLILAKGKGSEAIMSVYNASVIDVDGDLILAKGKYSDAIMYVYNASAINVDGDLILAKGDGSDAMLDIDFDWWDPDIDPTHLDINGGKGHLYLGYGDDSWAGDWWDPFRIHHGMVVDVNDVYLGYGENSWGLMTVDEASRLNYIGRLYIGYGGEGELDIDYGWAGPKDVLNLNAILGYGEGSSGTLYIQDVNNQQLNLVNNDDNSFTLGHGDASYAYMSVYNASAINVDGDLILAKGKGSDAMLDIDFDWWDPDIDPTRLNINGGEGNLYLGYGDDSWGGGSWGPLSIHHGMVVDVNNVYLGYGEGSWGGMSVDEASRLKYNGRLYIGYGGTGQLNIDYGWVGPLDSPVDLDAILGYGEGSYGELYIQDVNNQQLNLVNNDDNGFTLGHGGDAYMYVHNASVIDVDGDLILGKGEGSWAGLEIDFSGADNDPTHLDINGGEGNLYLGYGDYSWGGGDVVDPLGIYHGMVVDVNNVYLGYGENSWGGMSVDEESRLNYNGRLYIGYGGEGELDIDYGWVGPKDDLNLDAILGYQDGSSGTLNIWDVNNQQLHLVNNDDNGFTLGHGGDAYMYVYNASGIDVDGDLILAKGDGSDAMLDIDFDWWDDDIYPTHLDINGGKGNLYLGFGNDSWAGDWWDPFRIHDGMEVDVNDVYIAYGANSQAYMTVDEASSLDYKGRLYVGYGGTGQLDIDYGWVDSAVNLNAILGFGEDSSGTLNIQDLNNQQLNLVNNDPNGFTLGHGGDAYMSVYNASRINVDGDLILAKGDDSDAMLEIDFDHPDDIIDPTHLDINGGKGNLYLGYGDNSWAGGREWVWDSISGWHWDWSAGLEIHDGMVVDVNDVYLGYGAGSSGVMYVDADSTLNYSGRLYVGYRGTGGLGIDYGNADDTVHLNAILGHDPNSSGTLYIEDLNNQQIHLVDNDNSFTLGHGDNSEANLYVNNASGIIVDGDLILAKGDGSDAMLEIDFDWWDEDIDPTHLDINGGEGNLYLGYGDNSRAGGDWDGDQAFEYDPLRIHDRMEVDVNNVYLGYGADSWGGMSVDEESRLNYNGTLYVGYGGEGELDIDYGWVGPDDSPVKLDAILGYQGGSSGMLNIWDVNNQQLNLVNNDARGFVLGHGDDSEASLYVYNASGINVDGDLILAKGDGSDAMLDIDFDWWDEDIDPTHLDINGGKGNLYLGFGNDSWAGDWWDPFRIHDGMVVDVNDVYLGYGEGSSGAMTVDEASRLNYNGRLYIGYGGTGYLDIDYGWADSPVDMNVILGYGEGSSGTLEIQDVNNQQLNLVNNDENGFTLGHGGDAYMYINNAKKINVDGDLILAKGDGSSAMLEIDFYGADNDSTHLDINGGEGNLYLGYGDYSWAGDRWDPFRIHDGMVVDVNNVYLGYGADSWGGMSVDEASRLNYNGTLYVGYGGGGYLNIDYGWVDSPVDMNAILGYGEGSYGSYGTLEIQDVNNQDLNLSSNANGDFIVGNGEVYINDVNGINVSGDLILAKNDDSSAVMTFDNANSLDVGGTLYLGYGEDSEAELPIGNGVSVNVNQDVFVDYGPGRLSPCTSDQYGPCMDWEDLLWNPDYSVSVLEIDPNANLDVGGDLWVGYGTNSVGAVILDNAVLDVNNNIILGFQSHSYGYMSVYEDSDLSFGGQMFVGYGGHGMLEIGDVDTLDLDEGVVFFGYGAGSSANVEIEDVNRVNVDGNLNLAYGQDSYAMMEFEYVNDVNVTGNLNLAYGQDSWGAMRLEHVSDVNIAGDLNLAHGPNSNVPKVDLTNVNMQVGGDLNLGYGAGSTFGTLNVLDSRVDVGNSLYMGYGGTADEMIITRSFIGVGSNPYALDEGLSIGADGTLAGEGRIWGDVYNQGTIAPGSSIGTLNIVGDLTFDVNSVYAVDIADSDNSSDKIEVKGDLIINGGTVKVTPTETITQNRRYTIAEAHSVTNNDGWDSDDVIVTAPSVLLDVKDPHLEFSDTDVVLGVKPLKFGEPEVLQTASGNQSSLGGALDQSGNDVLTYALQQIRSDSDLLAAYNQLSNQSRPPMNPITSDVSMRFLGVMGERLRGIRPVAGRGYRGGPLLAMSGPVSATSGISPYGTMGTMAVGYNNPVLSAMAVGRGSSVLSDRRWGLWTKGYGVFGDRDSKSGVTGHDYRVGGLGVGLDYRFTDAFLAGLTLGYSEGGVDYDELRDNTDIGSTNLGAYASYEQDSWYIDAMFGYGKHEYDSIRYVDIVSERLTASYDGHSLSGYMELGVNWRETETSLLQPLVGLQIGHVTIDSYQESGGSTAVGVDKTDYDSIKSSLGLKYTHMFGAMTDGLDGSVQLRGRWLHEFGDDNSSVDTYFTSNPDAVYRMQDAEVSRDSALLGGSLSINISKQTLATIQYDVRLNSDETTQFIGGSLQYRW